MNGNARPIVGVGFADLKCDELVASAVYVGFTKIRKDKRYRISALQRGKLSIGSNALIGNKNRGIANMIGHLRDDNRDIQTILIPSRVGIGS